MYSQYPAGPPAPQQNLSPAPRFPGIVTLAIGAGAVWQLWRSDSTAFFAARARW